MVASWHLSFFQEQSALLWHFLHAEGCTGDLPSGGWHHPCQQALLVCLCLYCLTIDMPLASFVQSVERVVQQKGLFHGKLGRATTDFPGQESDLLTICSSCNAPNCHFRHSMQWPFGHSLVGGAKPL